MKDIRQLFDLNIGLVLSGGGAKGAYEAGIFKALWELDIIRRVSVVSGTSIGTINGLMLSMNDNSIMDESWSSLTYSRFINHQTLARNLKISKLLKKVRYIGTEEKFNELLSGSDLGLLSQSGIREFIEEYVNFQIIKESNKTLYACAYNIDLKTPEYFRLNDYEGDELIDIVLASCAVPFIFKPIKINGYRYADGGINNPQYVCQNADNVPIAPLKHHNCITLSPSKTSIPIAVPKIPFNIRVCVNINIAGARMHKTTPIAISFPYLILSSIYASASSIVIVGILLVSVIVVLMPSSFTSSSIFPNSEITMPIASFSVLPLSLSSLYLSSIFKRSSSLIFIISADLGKLEKILSK